MINNKESEQKQEAQALELKNGIANDIRYTQKFVKATNLYECERK
jgi:hypothetical protein